jgi:hypothetical protein
VLPVVVWESCRYWAHDAKAGIADLAADQQIIAATQTKVDAKRKAA